MAKARFETVYLRPKLVALHLRWSYGRTVQVNSVRGTAKPFEAHESLPTYAISVPAVEDRAVAGG